MSIIVALVLIVIVRAVWPKADPGAKIAAIGSVLFAIWALIAVTNQHAAVTVAAMVASGISQLTHSAGLLITHLSVPRKK